MTTKGFSLFGTALVMAAVTAVPAFAQEMPVEGPVTTTALISVQSKSNTPITAEALKLEVNGHQAPITAVTPVRREKIQVAILIDDGLRGNFGVQLDDLRKFVNSMPPNIEVLVGYMQNGSVRHEGGFTNNHAEALKHLRVPLSSPGISASPYFCLQDIVKHWPGEGSAARTVLMLTNGVDPYNGTVSPLNQDSPYVVSAQRDAQRAGVAVYAIYYPDSGIGGTFANFSGQSYLNQVAEATGGESFYQGRITPPSIAPYLDDFRMALAESYLVSFQASATHEKKDTLTEIKIQSDQPGVKVRAPHGVHPGLAEEASE